MTGALTPLLILPYFRSPYINGVLQEVPSRQEADPVAADQQGSVRPSRRKRSATRIETSPQRYGAPLFLREGSLGGILMLITFSRRKSACQTVSGEVANQAFASHAPSRGPKVEANTRQEPDAPPTEDADRLSATRSEVESAMNHRRRRTVLRDACFSPEALNAFDAGNAHLRAAQDGLTRATEQYVKDIRVSNFNSYIC